MQAKFRSSYAYCRILFLLCDTVNVAYVMYGFNKPPGVNASVFYAGQGPLPNLKKGVFFPFGKWVNLSESRTCYAPSTKKPELIAYTRRRKFSV